MKLQNCVTLVDWIEESAQKYPRQIALNFMGKKTSYLRLAEKIHIAAKALVALGVKSGDIVCVAMPNMPQAIVFIYAANSIGVTVNMIHPLSSKNEIRDFVNRVNKAASSG